MCKNWTLGCQFCLCFLVGGFCVWTCLWSKLIKQHFHEHPFETVDFTSRDDHFCSFTISKASSERPNPYLILRTSNSPPPCKSKSSSTYHVLSTGKVKLVPIFGDIWTYLHHHCWIPHLSLEFREMEICRGACMSLSLSPTSSQKKVRLTTYSQII